MYPICFLSQGMKQFPGDYSELLTSGVWEAEGILCEAVTRGHQGSRAGEELEGREGSCVADRNANCCGEYV